MADLAGLSLLIQDQSRLLQDLIQKNPDELCLESTQITRIRNELVKIAHSIVCLAQGPIDRVITLSYAAIDAANLEAILRMRVPEHVPAEGSISFTDLATRIGADEDILTRLARFAITNGIFTEPAPGILSHSAVSATLATNSSLRDVAQHNTSMISRICANISAWEQSWLKARQDPTYDKAALPAAPFNLTYPGFEDCFDFMTKNPDKAREYYSFLDGRAQLPRYRANDLLTSWDWHKQLKAGGTVVDIGGSSGHIAAMLAREVSSVRFIVQDNNQEAMGKGKKALEGSGLEERVTFMTHDFFTPQTISADVYYLRNILHDWNDNNCIAILRNLSPALKGGAKILINEVVLPDPPSVMSPLLDDRQALIDDHVMMGAHNARERSIEQYNRIFSEASSRWTYIKATGAVNGLVGIANSLLEYEWL